MWCLHVQRFPRYSLPSQTRAERLPISHLLGQDFSAPPTLSPIRPNSTSASDPHHDIARDLSSCGNNGSKLPNLDDRVGDDVRFRSLRAGYHHPITIPQDFRVLELSHQRFGPNPANTIPISTTFLTVILVSRNTSFSIEQGRVLNQSTCSS